MVQSRLTTAIATVILLIIIVIAIFAAITYPRQAINFDISFAIGSDSKAAMFNQQILDDKVQVVVSVQNGAALWLAQILQNGQVIWEHAAAQGEQQSYNSGWIQLVSGNYNLPLAR